MSSSSDEALLLAARRDADAFAEFHRRHARPLAGFLVRRTGDPEAAADLPAEFPHRRPAGPAADVIVIMGRDHANRE